MIFGFDAWIIWMAAAIILLLIEATTISLIPIWFACGSILAVFLDWFGLPVALQLAVMLVASVGLMFISMVIIRPRLHQSGENAIPSSEFIGHEGIVIDRIDPASGVGLIFLCDQTWSAGSESGMIIEKDTRVQVILIRGQKAIVRPITEDPPGANPEKDQGKVPDKETNQKPDAPAGPSPEDRPKDAMPPAVPPAVPPAGPSSGPPAIPPAGPSSGPQADARVKETDLPAETRQHPLIHR